MPDMDKAESVPGIFSQEIELCRLRSVWTWPRRVEMTHLSVRAQLLQTRTEVLRWCHVSFACNRRRRAGGVPLLLAGSSPQSRSALARAPAWLGDRHLRRGA